jgi:hypothetical protein
LPSSFDILCVSVFPNFSRKAFRPLKNSEHRFIEESNIYTMNFI